MFSTSQIALAEIGIIQKVWGKAKVINELA